MGDSIMSKLRLHGDTSGHVDLQAPAVAGTTTIDLGNVVTTDNADTKNIITTSNLASNLSSAGAITDQGNFLNIPTAASDPTVDQVAGSLYFRTTDNKIRYYNGTEWISLEDLGPKLVEFKLWGAGGGSGSQNRSGTNYHTTSYYAVKTGGAGGFVTCAFDIIPGTVLTLSVGGPGRGGLQQGNPSSAGGGDNGGGNSTYSSNDAGGGGGGYSGVFVGSKTQASAIAIAPGGGGGAGGPGYPSNTDDQANGGGGINSVDGTGNNGARNYGYFNSLAGGGTPTAGGAAGTATVADGPGNAGSALAGADANYYGNAWGAGGGGGGGWFGGGSGANDGSSWSGGGGGAGSAFVRGSGITYNADGLSSIDGVFYKTHSYATETFGNDNTTYNSMRVPAASATSDPEYPGGSVGYGGDFNTSPAAGLDGGGGAIAYRIGGSGNWTVLTSGDTTITV